jgi:hypothetical protein
MLRGWSLPPPFCSAGGQTRSSVGGIANHYVISAIFQPMALSRMEGAESRPLDRCGQPRRAHGPVTARWGDSVKAAASGASGTRSAAEGLALIEVWRAVGSWRARRGRNEQGRTGRHDDARRGVPREAAMRPIFPQVPVGRDSRPMPTRHARRREEVGAAHHAADVRQ